jgi:hypothetical protein
MYIPGARERVQVTGRIGVFLVVWVDQEQRKVDLIPLYSPETVEENIPFSQLEPYRENIPLETARKSHAIS